MEATNPTEAIEDQNKATNTIKRLANFDISNNLMIKAAMSIGNTQYPKTQRLCNKETLDPSKFPFIETTTPPMKTITNIVTNTSPLSSVSFSVEIIKHKMRVRSKGPHKSQFFNSTLLSTVNRGYIT
mmetsp:Transcript_13872/g.14415  ORF Transcript_13872/g.14415 Transcript_13872/m.14415 type:complete len:127 (-) Transcript_13872:371-751(-)